MCNLGMAESWSGPDASRSSLPADRSPGPGLIRPLRQLALGAVATLALTVLPPALYGSSTAGSHVVIVESNDAAGKIDRQRLNRIVEQVCSEFHIAELAVPEIIFIHVTGDEARAAGVPAGTTVMVERSFLSVEWKGDAMPARFLVWVVGRVDDQMMVGAVAHVLRLHLQLTLSDRDLLLAEKRILERLNATVDVSSFVKPRQ